LTNIASNIASIDQWIILCHSMSLNGDIYVTLRLTPKEVFMPWLKRLFLSLAFAILSIIVSVCWVAIATMVGEHITLFECVVVVLGTEAVLWLCIIAGDIT